MFRKSVYGLILGIIFLVGILFRQWSVNHTDTPERVLQYIDEICKYQTDRTRNILCFRKNLEEPVSRTGVGPYMTALSNTFQKNDNAQTGGVTRCHDIAHAIGQVGAQSGKNLTSVLSGCLDVCTSGCYHGAVEGYIAGGNDLVALLPRLCTPDTTNSLSVSARSACYHGLGHGVASVAGFQLQNALTLCDRVDPSGQKDCGAGVIMELFEPSSFDHAQLLFPENIPVFCGSLSPTYASVCYMTAGLHEYARSHDDSKALATCALVPKDIQNGCVSSLGQNIYFYVQGRSMDVVDFCQKSGSTRQEPCLSGAIEASVMSDPIARHGFEICNDVQSEMNTFCYRELGKHIFQRMGVEKRKQLCDAIESSREKLACVGE